MADTKVVSLLEEIRDLQKKSLENAERYRKLTWRLVIVFVIIVFIPLIIDIVF